MWSHCYREVSFFCLTCHIIAISDSLFGIWPGVFFIWAGVFGVWDGVIGIWDGVLGKVCFIFDTVVIVVALLQGGLIMRLTCHIIVRAFRRWIGTQIKFQPSCGHVGGHEEDGDCYGDDHAYDNPGTWLTLVDELSECCIQHKISQHKKQKILNEVLT